MKQTCFILGGLAAALPVLAQTPYMNENYMPTDLLGSARYVGMGGALGALGADISAGSNNPAALGLYRRSDASVSFSVRTQSEKPDLNADMTHMSFDQLGFVVSVPIGGDVVKFVNFAVNYQKRNDFNLSFIADNSSLNGLSQTQQMTDLLNYTSYSTPLASLMYNSYLVNPVTGSDGSTSSYTGLSSDENQYDRTAEGYIAGYDFNVSLNLMDRLYLGLTLGVNDVDYYSYSTYREFGSLTDSEGNSYSGNEYYSLYNTQHVSGYGVNVKLGAIVRPFEESPFRVGFTFETPTYYHLDSYSSYSIDSPFYESTDGSILYDGNYISYLPDYDLSKLQMKITTPWKIRVSLGHTIGSYIALGAEYEYANYSKTKQAYQDWGYDGYWDDWYYGHVTKDAEMNKLHKSTLKASHSFKFGAEFNVTDNVALRVGYNYYSSMFEDGATLDQTIDSPAFNYQTTTDYMNKGDVNIFTAGLGYHGKHLYADVAYKFRKQSGEFYAFDDTYIYSDETGRLSAVDVNMDTHQVFFSLGYKF